MSADTLGYQSWVGQEIVLVSLIFVVWDVSASSNWRSPGRGGDIRRALVGAFDGGACQHLCMEATIHSYTGATVVPSFGTVEEVWSNCGTAYH